MKIKETIMEYGKSVFVSTVFSIIFTVIAFLLKGISMEEANQNSMIAIVILVIGVYGFIFMNVRKDDEETGE